MRFWQQFTANKILLAALAAWAAAQLLKMLINAFTLKDWDWSRLVGDGGMPSGHSATVTALATASLLQYGLSSFQFAVTAVLAIVVMHDACGVRLEAGKHAKSINELFALMGQPTAPEQVLQELLGHTPLQVAAGAVLGVLVALLLR